MNFVLSQPKCNPANFLQTYQLKLKRETKVLQEEAFLSLYLALKPLHCTLKLLVANYWKTCLILHKFINTQSSN